MKNLVSQINFRKTEDIKSKWKQNKALRGYNSPTTIMKRAKVTRVINTCLQRDPPNNVITDTIDIRIYRYIYLYYIVYFFSIGYSKEKRFIY